MRLSKAKGPEPVRMLLVSVVLSLHSVFVDTTGLSLHPMIKYSCKKLNNVFGSVYNGPYVAL